MEFRISIRASDRLVLKICLMPIDVAVWGLELAIGKARVLHECLSITPHTYR